MLNVVLTVSDPKGAGGQGKGAKGVEGGVGGGNFYERCIVQFDPTYQKIGRISLKNESQNVLASPKTSI